MAVKGNMKSSTSGCDCGHDTCQGDCLKHEGKPEPGKIKLYTIGYEGRRPKSLLKILKEQYVKIIVDVREVNISKNPAYSGPAISRLLGQNGIGYIHFSILGAPRELRAKLRQDGNYEEFFDSYKSYILENPSYLLDLHRISESNTVCLLCTERDRQKCHRKILAEALAFGFENLYEIIHL